LCLVEDSSLAFSSMVRSRNGKLAALALLGGVALTAGSPPPQRMDAQPAPAAQTWLTIERPHLCQLTVAPHSFTRRCTTNWYLDNLGNILSGDPTWASILAVADMGALPTRPLGAHGVRVPSAPTAPKQVRSAPRYVPPVLVAAGPYSLWASPPGHPSYALPEFTNDPNAAFYGTCTWYAQYRRPSEPLVRLGNAAQWAWNAPTFGLRTGTTPVVGATVVFQPGVLGASGGGHVGHVEAVYVGGWFLISEMNMDWNGGGFGRVSFRYVVVMAGVSFVY
jgi:surface antigen